LHVPCLTSNQMLTLYRYVPFPYPVSTTHPLSSDPHPSIHNTNDILSRHFKNRSSLFFLPETELIAVGRNNNNKRYQLVSQAILAGCIQQNHIFLCDRHQVLRKDLAGSCLGALFLQNQQGVIKNCKVAYKPLRETVYQLSTNDHLIFSPTPLLAQIQCSNGSHFPQQIIDITKIHLPDFCSINLVNHTITLSRHRSQNDDAESHYNMWTLLHWPVTPRTKSATSPEPIMSPAPNPACQSGPQNKSPERYCNKRVLSLTHTLIPECVCNILHAWLVYKYKTPRQDSGALKLD
jgi:hypothetical protein